MTPAEGHVHLTVLPNTEYTRPIAYSIWDMDLTTKNLFTDPWNEVEVKWKLSDVHEDLARYAHTKYSYPFTYNKREFNITKNLSFFFLVVNEPWKWGQGHWTCDWRNFVTWGTHIHSMKHPGLPPSKI